MKTEAYAYGYLIGVITGIIKCWNISPELKSMLEDALIKAKQLENENKMIE